MTSYTIGASRTEFRTHTTAAPTGGMATRLWIAAYRAYMRARSRNMMRGLPDDILKDVGLSRADIEREASKPFWR